MTPGQLRAARAMLQLKVEELAGEAQVAPNTIIRFENEHGSMRRATLAAIQRAVFARGVEATPDGGIRPLRQPLTSAAA